MALVENTFWEDFTIADKFGDDAISDTYKSCLEWKSDLKMFTALVAVLNWKCWWWYERGNEERCKLYADLYHRAYNIGCDTFRGEDFTYFWKTLD